MKLKATLKSSAAILVGLAIGSSATTAAAVTVVDVFISETGLGVGQASGSLVLPVGTGNYWAGSLDISIAATASGASPTSFVAYCVDPAHFSSGAFMPYLTPASTDSLSAAFPTRAAAIQSLFNQYYAGTVGNDAEAAAFQLALWEVAADDRSLAAGGVHASATTNAALVSAATAMLSGLNYLGPNVYDLTVYRVDRAAAGQTGQDYIVASADPQYVTPIPEPGSYGMVMAGLGLIGLTTLLRRRA